MSPPKKLLMRLAILATPVDGLIVVAERSAMRQVVLRKNASLHITRHLLQVGARLGRSVKIRGSAHIQMIHRYGRQHTPVILRYLRMRAHCQRLIKRNMDDGVLGNIEFARVR